MNFFTTAATPSSSLEAVMKSAFCLTISWAFAIATPNPAYFIIEISLNPSPIAMSSVSFQNWRID